MMPDTESNVRREPFVAFVTDRETRDSMLGAVRRKGWAENRVVLGSIEEAAQALAKVVTPSLIILDISESQDAMADLNRLAESCDPGTRVIAVGAVNDVALFRTLMGAGVEDYLVKPLDEDALFEALDREPVVPVAAPEQSTKADAETKRVFVVGARGGVGTGTIALNLAWMAAHEEDRKTALVDTDVYFGTAALAFDIEPGAGMREALENPSRIDSLFIERAMVKQSEKLALLTCEEGLGQSCQMTSEAMETLLAEVEQSYPFVVLDVPRFLVPNLLPLMDGECTILLVTELSLAGMRDSLRLLRAFKEFSPKAKVKLVANKVGMAKSVEMAVKDFERGAEAAINFSIPYDLKPAAEADAAGKAMAAIAKKGKAVTVIRDILADEFRSGEDQEKKGLLGRLFGKG